MEENIFRPYAEELGRIMENPHDKSLKHWGRCLRNWGIEFATSDLPLDKKFEMLEEYAPVLNNIYPTLEKKGVLDLKPAIEIYMINNLRNAVLRAVDSLEKIPSALLKVFDIEQNTKLYSM